MQLFELFNNRLRDKRLTKAGAIHWCTVCGRRHRRRESCELVEVERRAKSGRIVKRLSHAMSRTEQDK